MEVQHILPTGLTKCYSEDGEVIGCHGTGQDAEFYSVGDAGGWSAERFELLGDHLVQDKATDLIWARNSCPSEFPLSWQEGLDFIDLMKDEARYDRSDWRMPNRCELRSLIDHSARKPAITPENPFQNVL